MFLCLGILALSSCYVSRAYKYRKFKLEDVAKQPSLLLEKAIVPYHYAYSKTVNKSLNSFLDSNLANSYTYSFLVIKNDSILYEKYFGGIDTGTLQPSFSVAKSFISTLVAIAFEEGKIKDLQEPITNYIPFLLKNNKSFSNITIQHLLDMSSGIKSNEDYGNPFSDVLKLGFTKNMKGKLKKLKIETAPGKQDYKSVNTQLLALIVEQATGKKIQDYMVEKIWHPLGMETTATWNIDSKRNNVAKAFCCINATTKDFAKLGSMFLHKGYWNGHQIVSSSWVNNTVNGDTLRKYEGYKNQWWAGSTAEYFTDSLKAVAYSKANQCPRVFVYITKENKKYFGVSCEQIPYYAQGILGQFVYVDPKKNLVVVRLGHYWKHPKWSEERVIREAVNRVQ